VPLLRLQRPGWSERPDDGWHWVADLDAAAAAIPSLGERVLLTIGRRGLRAFADIQDAWFLVRCFERPDPPLPPRHLLLLDRGPFTLDDELALAQEHRIELIVTKDRGGAHAEAKLEVARRLGLPVIVVRRPPRPEVASVSTVTDALAWSLEQAHPG